MEDFLVSALTDLIIELGKGAFSGIKGKIKIYFIKKKLKENIFNEILKKYGDKCFYNDLDHFLTNNDVICSIIRNCYDISFSEYKSKSQMITYYVQLYIEQHPEYRKYHYEVKNIIQKYFDIIYRSLNKSNNDDIRIVSNIAKELSAELSSELQDIKLMLGTIDKKLDGRSDGSETVVDIIFIDDYRKHLLCLYPTYSANQYIERKIYPKDESDKKTDALDILLNEKSILVLGEAGYGKTYEAITLIQKACSNEKTRNLIPVFLPLQEYGLLYLDIISGIKHKLSPFSEGNIDKIIETKLRNGEFLLVFDGIDDISQDIFRTKFHVDFKNLSAQYNNNYFFVTSRFNRYNGELGEKQQYHLTGINEQIIREELRKEGIYADIPKHYYELFSNPFFLSVGKAVLKKNASRTIFNRSKLFEELFQKLYGGISQQSTQVGNISLTYSDAINILGNLAFHTFLTPSYSYMEFDQQISKIVNENKVNVINSFVCSGLFKIQDKVNFAHKLLKEYCAAYYLIQKFPLSENLDMYLNLIEKDEWKEVFIFAGGIFTNSQLQDVFLDFVMEHNFPLYVECVKAKSDIVQLEDSNNTNRILSQIFKTYRFIVNRYFKPIERCFDPIPSREFFKEDENKKIGIIGCLSEDKKHLSYWFDFIQESENDVQCITEQQLKDCYADFEKSAILHRRNFSSYGINMELSGLTVESGRNIAIDIIKNRLDTLIKNRQLIESKFLLCERISCYQKKLKILKGIDNLVEMQTIVDGVINESLATSPNMVGYSYNGVELFSLRDLLHCLNQANIKLEEHILPREDVPFPASGPCFVWDLYSKEQKELRLSLFFYYHEISYLDMVEYNFPNLKRYFKRFNDAPYQVIVEINHKEDVEPHDFYSEPLVNYYYIASPNSDIPLPEIKRVNEEEFTSHDEIFKIIRESYEMQGRMANRLSTASTGFTITTTSRHSGSNVPLSEYVYDSIKESLSEIFGPFR